MCKKAFQFDFDRVCLHHLFDAGHGGGLGGCPIDTVFDPIANPTRKVAI